MRVRAILTNRLVAYPLLIGGFYLGVCAYLGYAFVRPPRTVPRTPETLQDVLVPTADGPDPAWATKGLANGDHPAQIVFVMSHGYGGTRATWRGIAEAVQKAGHEAVVPAMPGQDASPCKSVGFGKTEAQVIVETVRWVRSRYPVAHPPKVILLGVSMGGAASWLASEQIPDQVSAVITEGAFARFNQTMNHWFDQLAPGASSYMKPVVFFARKFVDIDPASIVPLEAAAKWRKPALIIQAGNDRLILRHNAVDLSAASHAPLWIVPGAGHARCFITDQKGYTSRILDMAIEVGHHLGN